MSTERKTLKQLESDLDSIQGILPDGFVLYNTAEVLGSFYGGYHEHMRRHRIPYKIIGYSDIFNKLGLGAAIIQLIALRQVVSSDDLVRQFDKSWASLKKHVDKAIESGFILKLKAHRKNVFVMNKSFFLDKG